MKRTIIYLLSVILGTALFDLIFRPLCSWTYSNPIPNSTILEGTNKFAYVTKKSKVIVLGASRAERHYAVKTIEDSLQVSAYNYGGAGCDIIQQYLSLLTSIKNETPKVVILDLSASQLSEEWIKEKNSRYYPFYWENDSVKTIVDDVGGWKMKYLLLSSFIQYNSKLSYILLRLLRQKSSNIDIEGFRPLPYTGKPAKCRNRDVKSENAKGVDYSQTALKYLQRIVSTCKKNHIDLVICYSPSLKNDLVEIDGVKELCQEFNLAFWDYSNKINDPLLFRDENHLNEKGALKFTELVIAQLKADYPFLFERKVHSH